MTTVNFYEEAADEKLKFAVIIAKKGRKVDLLQAQGTGHIRNSRRTQGAGRKNRANRKA